MEGTSYPYAVGVVKAKEDSLLSPAVWQRLETGSREEAVQALADAGYGMGEREPQAMIVAELAETRRLLLEISPEPQLLGALFVQTDAHNLKVIFKSRLVQRDPAPLLQEGGTLDTETLVLCAKAGEYGQLPEPIGSRLNAIEQSLTPESDPAQLSSALDDAIYAYALSLLSGRSAQGFKEYVLQKIELTNLLTLLRARILKMDATAVAAMLISCGETSVTQWLRLYRMTPEEFRSSLGDPLKEAVADAAKEDIGKAEQAVRVALDQKLSGAKDDSFGVGPLLWYFSAKQEEARRLRLLFAHKEATR